MENSYTSIFSQRYCRNSKLLTYFSERYRAETWRQLWIWLAECEKELGLSQITDEMIEELERNKKDIDWDAFRSMEKRLKHDVMAHIEIYKEKCPKASGIIHLGATSCFVQDNSDLIIQREAIIFILSKLGTTLKYINDFASKYKSQPTVGRTHFQPASFVTVGKRACIWAQELLMAAEQIKYVFSEMKFRGIKGATGTQDSFLTLFDGKEGIVKKLDDLITTRAGFQNHFNITGQTYSRQQDTQIIFSLSNLASVAKKISTDIRLLQSWQEILEPFESEQVGSSAMPHKRNPIKTERICGIARHLMSAVQESLQTLAEQGLERTLDDSSNRRLLIADAFLAADVILTTLNNVFQGLYVNLEGIKRNNEAELPFVAMEKVLILLTKYGIDRQEAHAKIRKIVNEKREKVGGQPVTVDEMLEDPFFDQVRHEAKELINDPLNFCGRSVTQTEEFLKNELLPFVNELVQYDKIVLDSTTELEI